MCTSRVWILSYWQKRILVRWTSTAAQNVENCAKRAVVYIIMRVRVHARVQLFKHAFNVCVCSY